MESCANCPKIHEINPPTEIPRSRKFTKTPVLFTVLINEKIKDKIPSSSPRKKEKMPPTFPYLPTRHVTFFPFIMYITIFTLIRAPGAYLNLKLQGAVLIGRWLLKEGGINQLKFQNFGIVSFQIAPSFKGHLPTSAAL